MLTPRFSANRTVREYTEQHYLPAAASYRVRSSDKGAMGNKLVNWQNTLDQKWASIRFGEINIETIEQQHVFEVKVYLNDIDPNEVRVELYADGINGSTPERQEMKRGLQPVGIDKEYIYNISVSSIGLRQTILRRVIPHYDGVAIPLEAAQILWQR